jgi:hypothetical protein
MIASAFSGFLDEPDGDIDAEFESLVPVPSVLGLFQQRVDLGVKCLNLLVELDQIVAEQGPTRKD